jgi:hypothetical protein
MNDLQVLNLTAVRDDDAFAGLVQLCSGFVYRTGLRQLGESSAAEDCKSGKYASAAAAVESLRRSSP